MATLEAIAIRKAGAQDRIAAAARSLAKNAGIQAPDLAPTHKDLAIQGAVQLEAVADFLEVIAKHADKKAAKSAPATKPAAQTAADAALAQAEATRLAEKLKAEKEANANGDAATDTPPATTDTNTTTDNGDDKVE